MSLTMVWYSYEPGGEVRIITGRTSRKGKLLECAGRFSLCVQTETLPYKYVSVEGRSLPSKQRILSAIGAPSHAVTSARKWATRTSKARGTWSETCLSVWGQHDGSPSSTQSNTSHGEGQVRSPLDNRSRDALVVE